MVALHVLPAVLGADRAARVALAHLAAIRLVEPRRALAFGMVHSDLRHGAWGTAEWKLGIHVRTLGARKTLLNALAC